MLKFCMLEISTYLVFFKKKGTDLNLLFTVHHSWYHCCCQHRFTYSAKNMLFVTLSFLFKRLILLYLKDTTRLSNLFTVLALLHVRCPRQGYPKTVRKALTEPPTNKINEKNNSGEFCKKSGISLDPNHFNFLKLKLLLNIFRLTKSPHLNGFLNILQRCNHYN